MDRPATIWLALRAALPKGQTLPEAEWQRRHRLLLMVLTAHVVLLPAYGALRGYGSLHSLLHCAPLVGFAALGMAPRLTRRLRGILVALGLLTASALTVHISDGVTEAHFHFFVVVVALTLYEDWLAFGLAVAFVFLHHGVLGWIDPALVHLPDGSAWGWAAVHGGFVLAAGAAAIVAWRLNEDVRVRAGEVEDRFRSAFDDAAIGMAVTSVDGRWLQVNAALCDLLGYPAEALVGREFRDVTHPDDLHDDVDALQRLACGEATRYSTEKRYLRADGQPVWVALNVSAVVGPEGPRYLISQIQDISERRRAVDELAHRALHDSLTDMPNRALFMDRLAVALGHMHRRPWPLAVMFVDLDRFKLVNDTLGHAAGDALLAQVAARLTAGVRSTDTVARLAGDEFTILCDSLMRPEEAHDIARRVVRSFDEPFSIDGTEVFVTASVGVAFGAPGKTSDVVLAEADAAMYRAKERVGSSFEVFRKGMQAKIAGRLRLESDLRHALERDELRLHYQPEYSLVSGDVVGVEALLRWQHPERGMVAPDQFICLAEENGLIGEIGSWVLREACTQFADWQARGMVGLHARIAVNVSARQLSGTLIHCVERTLAETGLRPEQLCLEVTESALLDDDGTGAIILADLERLGVMLAVDDFGKGFSSLARVKELPPIDFVKIDRSFVSGIGESVHDRAIVSSVVTLAGSLGIAAIAEGVETAEQAERLGQLGCGIVQGFYFSRPQPPGQLEHDLGSRHMAPAG